jgi:hypothetical protein
MRSHVAPRLVHLFREMHPWFSIEKDEKPMTILTEQEALTGSMDHAAKRVLSILMVGFVLIGWIAPWAVL